MNEVEFLNYVQESESIWGTKCRILNETYETPSLDGIEVEKEDAAELPSPFSESAVPKKAKRSKKEKDSGETQYLMEVFQRTNEFISSVKKGELDEDDLLVQSIAMEVKETFWI